MNLITLLFSTLSESIILLYSNAKRKCVTLLLDSQTQISIASQIFERFLFLTFASSWTSHTHGRHAIGFDCTNSNSTSIYANMVSLIAEFHVCMRQIIGDLSGMNNTTG